MAQGFSEQRETVEKKPLSNPPGKRARRPSKINNPPIPKKVGLKKEKGERT